MLPPAGRRLGRDDPVTVITTGMLTFAGCRRCHTGAPAAIRAEWRMPLALKGPDGIAYRGERRGAGSRQ